MSFNVSNIDMFRLNQGGYPGPGMTGSMDEEGWVINDNVKLGSQDKNHVSFELPPDTGTMQSYNSVEVITTDTKGSKTAFKAGDTIIKSWAGTAPEVDPAAEVPAPPPVNGKSNSPKIITMTEINRSITHEDLRFR